VLPVLLVVLLVPAVAQAREPVGPAPSMPVEITWSADAAELARTAPQAVENGTTAASCTGWRSSFVPPPTIRVLRTKGPDTGHVEQVDFRTYVLTVFGAEWQSFYPFEALKAASIAVKQYGWYYTIVYRGGVDASGACYDVQDNTNDQYYQPELRTPTPTHELALALTWGITLRKYQSSTATSRFFLTGYRQGTNNTCGGDRDGYHLYEHSVFYCAKTVKMTYVQILHTYLDPNLEIVRPGAHDIVGAQAGDISALVATTDHATMRPRLYEPVKPAGLHVAGSSALTFDASSLRGARSVDLSGDGQEDLLTLTTAGKTRLTLSVAVSNGADYGPLTTWWTGDVGRPVAGAQLVTADFNADGRNDAAVLLQDPPPASTPGSPPPIPTATLLLFRLRADMSSFAGPITWWNGPLDLSISRAWGADLNGDGRGDLLVQQDLGTGGVRFASALSPSITGPLMALTTRLDVPDLSAAKLLTTIGDVNRDGREDVWLVFPFNGGTRVDVLRARPNGGFLRFTLWTSAKADNLPFAKLKVETSDVNFDGLADLVLLRNDGQNGTTLVTLQSSYVNLSKSATLSDATLTWSAATPY
jgi:Stage II sporulation protein